MTPPLHIALAFRDPDGSYVRHAAAMLASVLASTCRGIHAHVLHDETLTPESKAKLCALPLLTSEDRHLHFHPVDPQACLPGLSEDSVVMRPLTYASLYRLFLPRIEALDNCPRLIYLDVDIIVDTDLGELWDTDMGDALLGAVPDPCLCGGLLRKGERNLDEWSRKVSRLNLHLGIPMGRYFNSGVLLLNLPDIRREGLFDTAAQMVLAQPSLLHPDQDALNKIFYTRSVLIDKKFNYLLHIDDVSAVKEGLWHYSGARKPWKDSTMPKAERYHHYLSQTAWAEEYA